MKKMLVLLAAGMLALTVFGAPNAPKGKCCAMSTMPQGLLQVRTLTRGLAVQPGPLVHKA